MIRSMKIFLGETMFARTLWHAAIVAAACFPGWAAGQAAPAPDIRLRSMQSLQAGRVRVSGREIGTITGSLAGVHDGALWFDDPAQRQIPVAAIDSVWVRRGHAKTGAILGGVVGVLLAVRYLIDRCGWGGDQSCVQSTEAGGDGMVLGGVAIGAILGSVTKSWKLRYP